MDKLIAKYPLTELQQSLWFEWKLNPDSRAYNLPYVFELIGALNIPILETCLQTLIQRHYALRTHFEEIDNQSFQIVDSELDLELEKITAKTQELEKIIEQKCNYLFDLLTPPLFKFILINSDENTHYLILNFHHIIVDGTSAALFIKELAECYNAMIAQQELILPEVDEDISEILSEEQNYLKSKEHEKDIQIWSELLKGANLYTSFPPLLPMHESNNKTSIYFEITDTLTQSLKNLASINTSTLFLLLMTCFKIFLYRYTGQEDLTLIYPTNARTKKSRFTLGYFVNILYSRTHLNKDLMLEDLLKQAAQERQTTASHRRLSILNLTKILQQGQTHRGRVACNVTFGLSYFGVQGLNFSGIKSRSLLTDLKDTQNELLLLYEDTGDKLIFKFWYDPKKIDKLVIEQMVTHFKHLLMEITKDPKKNIAKIPLLTSQEATEILFDWNHLKKFPSNKTINQIFEEQVERTPEQIAVSFEDTQLSYRELNEKANQLAHYLQKKYQQHFQQTLPPDTLIAIILDRSVEMIIAILATLKAGAAYVPIDPQYPVQRIQHTLHDSKAKFVLSQSSLIEDLQTLLKNLESPPVILPLDTDWSTIAKESKENLPANAQSNNLAYVIYTSGSTGTPKGVLIEHYNVVRLFLATVEFFGFNEKDVWTLFHSFAFDFSVWEIWGALLYGGKLIIVPYWITRSVDDFYDLLVKEKVTVLNQTPSAFKQLIAVDTKKAHEKLALRYVIFGGEALEFRILKPWFQTHPDNQPQLINMYGITETTVHATYFPIAKQLTHIKASIIGKAIPDLSLYVLDKSLQALPIAVIGELYIGGAGLARGYLNRPELNQERFIANPYAEKDDSRLYKTGDLVRWLPDGNLEYIERDDDQVKIRGFRIELGEIEAQLLNYPKISQCSVLVKTENGEKRLIAYLVLKKSESTIDVSDLREFLKEKLPDYMIPNAFASLENLPLTPNGKIDKKALLEKEVTYLKAETVYTEAKTENEKILAKIWAELLKQDISTLSTHDNFFELGGDSILSLQIIARARQAGLQLTPQQLFAHPTISSLAAVAQHKVEEKIDQGLATGKLPLTPIQKWFFEKITPDYSFYNQAIDCRINATLNLEYLKTALQFLFQHHDSLRLRYHKKENHWQQFYSNTNNSSELLYFESYNLSEFDELQQNKKIEQYNQQSHQRLILDPGPLVAACHYTFADDQHRLFLTIHHLIIDGVSWRILFEDLESLYQQLTNGVDSLNLSLPAKTVSFKVWSEHLNHYAQSDPLKSEYSYWLLQTTGVEKNRAGFDNSIPVDYPNNFDDFPKNNRVEYFQDIHSQLAVEETQALLSKVPSAYKTQINDSLLTALVLTFKKYFNSSFLLINLEGHGREEIFENLHISRTIGWFTSLFPVNLSLETDNIGNALRIIKEQLRHIPAKGIGYGILKYLCKDAKITDELRKEAKPILAFNYLGQLNGHTKTALIRPGPIKLWQTPEMTNDHLLEINSWVSDKHLQLTWSYSTQFYNEDTIQTLAENFIKHLRTLIDHCVQQKQTVYSPADFPLINLTLNEFDHLLTEDLKNWKMDDIRSLYPLTPLQKGLLFHELYDPNAHRYFVPLHLYFSGDLNIDALQQTCQSLIDQYDVLRTGFVGGELEEPVQFVIKNAIAPWKILDLRNLSEHEQQTAIQEFINQDVQQGFVLSEPPLIRFTLIRISDQEHILAWHNHHIILDGWSFGILLGDLLTRYKLLISDKSSPTTRTPKFQNFIAWLQKQDLTVAQAYWQNLLQGFTSSTQLPIRTRTKEHGQKQKTFELDSKLTEQIQNFTRENHITISTLLHGVLAYLLHSYSNENDIVFGSTTSGRSANLENIEQMVGLLINTLPVRSQLTANQSILEYLKEFQEQLFNSHRYDYTALTQIHLWSEVPTDTPLFNFLFVFENYPMEVFKKAAKDSLKLTRLENYEHSHYEISFSAMLINTLSLRLDYNSNLYTEENIENLFNHFINILNSFIVHPKQKIQDISLLSTEEKHKILIDWNDTQAEFPHDKTISQLFEEQVQRTPNNIAVSFEGQTLTYQELNERANQLAHYLQEQYQIFYANSLPPETLIAISIERSLEMPIAILATLKVGGAYVPIDPSYPISRIEYMLQDCQTKILLTKKNLMVQIQPILAHMKAPPLCIQLDADTQNLSAHSKDNIINNADPKQLAYIIYTSGSTGQPKGVMVQHDGVISRLWWSTKALKLTSEDIILQKAPISFDTSVWELLWPLLNGAKLVIAKPEAHRDEIYLKKIIAQEKITVVHFVPSMLKLFLIDNSLIEQSNHLKNVIAGGEELTKGTEKQFFDIFKNSQVKLYNFYGPTEASIHVTYWLCADNDKQNSIPIGFPVSNVQLYVLNNSLKPQPIGIPGNLYIGGLGLARAYLNRPELTAERFITTALENNTQLRLYKTGDLAYWLPDGALVFLGRSDEQVKIRGFRIELGEIESQLKTYEKIKDCVVLAEGENENKHLVAYIVPTEASTLDNSELRNFLQKKLPDYMIPNTFILLDAIPLTPIGKINKKELLEKEKRYLTATTELMPARSAEDQTLMEIWAEVLKRDIASFGINDNFFHMGGHSLLATQVISRIRKLFQVELFVSDLFAHPTVADLMDYIREKQLEKEAPSLRPPILPRPADAPAMLSFSQERLWFLDQLNPLYGFYNIPLAFRVKGPIDLSLLEKSFYQLIERQESLRTNFVNIEGQAFLNIIVPEKFQFKLDVETLTDDSDLLAHAALEAKKGFDLSKDSLIRVKIFHIGHEDHLLLITLHHIIADGWSLTLFYQELQQFYETNLGKKANTLSPLTTQYSDFAYWQRQWLQGEVLEKQLSYWKKQLKNTTNLEMPLDNPRPAIQTYNGQIFSVNLSSAITKKLKAISQNNNVTLFTTLFSVFSILLSRYSGQEDITIGTPIAGRTVIETEDLIGFFINTLVLRADLSAQPDFLTFLQRNHKMILDAYAHQDIPFEKLVEAFELERDPSRNPLFQVMFILQNAPEAELQLPDLNITALPTGYDSAKFDLTFSFAESEDGQLPGIIEYNTDLFNPETIQALWEHFVVLLEEITTNPEQLITEISMLTAQEQETLLQWGTSHE